MNYLSSLSVDGQPELSLYNFFGLHTADIGSLFGAINFTVTTENMRCNTVIFVHYSHPTRASSKACLLISRRHRGSKALLVASSITN